MEQYQFLDWQPLNDWLTTHDCSVVCNSIKHEKDIVWATHDNGLVGLHAAGRQIPLSVTGHLGLLHHEHLPLLVHDDPTHDVTHCLLGDRHVVSCNGIVHDFNMFKFHDITREGNTMDSYLGPIGVSGIHVEGKEGPRGSGS